MTSPTRQKNSMPFSFRKFSPIGLQGQNKPSLTSQRENTTSKSKEPKLIKPMNSIGDNSLETTEKKMQTAVNAELFESKKMLDEKIDSIPLKKQGESTDAGKISVKRRSVIEKVGLDVSNNKLQNKNTLKTVAETDRKQYFSNKYQSKSPTLFRNSCIENFEARKILFAPKKSLSPSQRIISGKLMLGNNNKLANLYSKKKTEKSQNNEKDELVSPYQRDNLFGDEVNVDAFESESGRVFKNQLIEKINHDLEENQKKNLKKDQDIPNEIKVGLKPISFAKIIPTTTESNRPSTFNSNAKPIQQISKMPINKKGEFTSKWQSIQAPKNENRISLGQKNETRNGETTLNTLSNNKEPKKVKTSSTFTEETNVDDSSGINPVQNKNTSPSRNIVFKSPNQREKSLPQDDDGTLRIRKKTLKIDKSNVDKRISNLMVKLTSNRNNSNLTQLSAKSDEKNAQERQIDLTESELELKIEKLVLDEDISDTCQPIEQTKNNSKREIVKKSKNEIDKLQTSSKSRGIESHRMKNKQELIEVLKSANQEKDKIQESSKISSEKESKVTAQTFRSSSINNDTGLKQNQVNDMKRDFHLINLIDEKTPLFPQILNSFMKFEAAPHIFAIGYNSHQGYVRDYNEDRISVVFSDKLVNNSKVSKYLPEPPVSFGLYSIFDGHNGFECSEFLKLNLHNVLLDQAFSSKSDFNQKIKKIYENFEVMYKLYSIKYKKSFAGSCAITVMQYNDFLTIINVGDSRVIMSQNSGLKILELSQDHKPEEVGEFNRVVSVGGYVYRSLWSWMTKKGYEETAVQFEEIAEYEKNTKDKPYLEIGPWRVNSGGLSVSRTFGDFESKYRELGGVPGSIICEPEIFEMSTKNSDFIVIGCELIR